MPRIRYLKPEFFSDEDLADLTFQTRLAYAGLWCYADKEGRLEDRPKYLKAMIFPYDNIDMDKQLEILTHPKRGNGVPFIQRYSVGDLKLIQILSWKKHQHLHHTERDSIFPPPPPFKDKDKDKDKDKAEEPESKLSNGSLTVKSPLKEIHGEFQNVTLTQKEFHNLIEQFGEIGTKERIENLSQGIASKGYRYKNHYATILSWERKNIQGEKKLSEDPIDKRLAEINAIRRKQNGHPKPT